MSPAVKLTVVEALSAVMGEVQSVGKDSRNTQQNYNFRGVDAVVNAVGPVLRKHGVVVVPVDATYEQERYTTKNGAVMRGVTITARFRFYGPGGDYIDACVCGESSDSGDKAVPKAHSVAYRTLLLEALCIPTDEPDPDESAHERASALPPSAGQAETAPDPEPEARSSDGTAGEEGSGASLVEEATEPQKKKLNVLVGKLRDAGQIKTTDLWIAAGWQPQKDEDGEVHWSTLREHLSKAQASELIERLEKFAKEKGID